MKSYLVFCLFTAAIMAARGSMDMYPIHSEASSALDNLEDPATGGPNSPQPNTPTGAPDTDAPSKAPGGEEKPNPHNCDCGKECHGLHNDQLPKEIQNEHKYLSYENFPVLCRDASAIMLPLTGDGKPRKKYVCKQVFDCCRKCNWLFYTCLSKKPNTYGFCMRGVYKCMCDCVEKKSHKELPYNPVSVDVSTPP